MSDTNNPYLSDSENTNEINESDPLKYRKKFYNYWFSFFIVIFIGVFLLTNDPTRKGKIHRNVRLYLMIFLICFMCVTLFLDPNSDTWYLFKLHDTNRKDLPRNVRLLTTITYSLVLSALFSTLIIGLYKNLYTKHIHTY